LQALGGPATRTEAEALTLERAARRECGPSDGKLRRGAQAPQGMSEAEVQARIAAAVGRRTQGYHQHLREIVSLGGAGT